MFFPFSANSARPGITRIAVICIAMLASWPAHTGTMNSDARTPAYASLSATESELARTTRRVKSDACLTELEIMETLSQLGFTDIVLGRNINANDMYADIRFGGDAYTVTINRCTALLQDVANRAEEEVM